MIPPGGAAEIPAVDPNSGQFSRFHTELQRGTRSISFRHLSTLCRIYPTPPPLQLHPPAMGAHASIAQGDYALPWATIEWPHFKESFRLLERILANARHFRFATTLSCHVHKHFARFDRDGIAVAHGIAPHAVAALGWCMTWWGHIRPASAITLCEHPAFGLAVWLAELPDRPAGMSQDRWVDCVADWLREDIATTWNAWQRITEFMHEHGAYFLHHALVPLGYLARRHRIPNMGRNYFNFLR
jgi:hypothetical protein